MRPKRTNPIWPYLGILACLFVLSVTAPRAWERMARRPKTTQVRTSQKIERAPRLATKSATKDKSRAGKSAPQAPLADATVRSADPAPATAPAAPPVPSAQNVVQSEEQSEPEESSSEPPAETSPQAAVVEVATDGLPQPLLAQLGALNAAWAEQAVELVRQLCETRGKASDTARAKEIIAELRKLAEPGKSSGSPDQSLVVQAARARYGLRRWLEVWEAAGGWSAPANGAGVNATAREILTLISKIEAQLASGAPGAGWRTYLDLDALRELAAAGAPDAAARRSMAQKILTRLASSKLSDAQRKFAGQGAIGALQRQLRAWDADEVSSEKLLADVERYEASGLPSDARTLARDWRALSLASPPEQARTARQVDTHYRNANVRVAVTAPLMNQLVTQPQALASPVRDWILNVPVCGRSTTFTKVKVRLIPDDAVIRLGLEARGVVSSDTVSSSGPARFRNVGQSSFLVRKLVVIGPSGLVSLPAVAEADNDYTNLVGMDTSFDGVPLVGSMVRSIARSQHDRSQADARAEVEQKVAIRARDQFEAEVAPQLAKAGQQADNKQLAALRRMGLELEPLGLSTSDERVVARLRIAGHEQLAAHTARPQAPSDSWLSVQLHLSVLNNVLERLELDGRTFTLPELFAWVGQRLDRPDWADRDDLPEDVRMTFASKDSVRVKSSEGRLQVTFAFAELKQAGKRWRNFSVYTYYKPEPDGRDARLVRDDTIHLSLRGIEPKLRAIFSRILSKNRDIHLMPESFVNDPRLEDLAITQFMVDEGWIALAYAPKRAAGKVARKPK